MAHSSRTWTGARTPQALKRVRQSARRHAILQPRRSAAKTHVAKTLLTASNGDAEQTREQLLLAISALDRAVKTGAIHRNAADRRKSRLMLKVNAALGGEMPLAAGKAQRQTGKAAAAKAAKARIAATKAVKAKGEQTAAGKARAALSRTTRDVKTTKTAEPTAASATKATSARSTSRSTTRASTAKASTTKTPATSTSRASTTRTTAKEPAAKRTKSSSSKS